MKNIIKLTFATFSILALSACSEGYIDDISSVAAGEDKAAPIVTIMNPASGTVNIPFTDTMADYTFDFKVSDDVEIKSINISLDGAPLNTYNTFLDYRNFTGSYLYKNLGLGNHTFKVDAVDLSGKTTTKTFAFNVTNVYQPLYLGETFFVPFDYPSSDPLKVVSDLLQNTPATSNPLSLTSGISGNGIQGANLKYITYSKPNDWVATAKSFTVSFWFKLNGQTKNNNGGNGPEHVFSIPTTTDHWSGGQGMLLMETNATGTQIKFPIVDKTKSDKWFNWEGADAIPGIADNNWKHCALVYDANTSKMTLYINGVANAKQQSWDNHGDINMDATTAKEFRIGAGPKEVNNDTADDWLRSSWKGGLDQFRLFNTALSATDIKNIFDSKL
ncbi:LamG domain-containing protein [Epilithonimonas hungarica]|uniref:Concanavalin A-like lectin/glucanases superfamily protein n=1 Tax=Epilithonimonas hungarica TaxID=454006 RepID=A0A1G7N937_9FLAO|nr:LamG domain-containing protein [Epilithonimonas hungarica]SDF70417.1 Concanavalin A-like lectin/glucanases superfamily protein [Epilithonimonas hungarica]